MKTTVKTNILQGIIIPALAFLAYGILCWATDSMGAVMSDILVDIPLALLAYLLIQKLRPVERKTMPGKCAAAMTVIFIIAVCTPAQLMFHAQANTGGATGWAIIPKSLITAPILEELVYRGIIFGLSRRVFGFWPATAVSAVLFQVGHFDLSLAIITIPVAIATAGVYELTGNLKYSMLLHSVFNLIAFFFVGIHIPRLMALPLYALSLVLSVLVFSKRDIVSGLLRIKVGDGHPGKQFF